MKTLDLLRRLEDLRERLDEIRHEHVHTYGVHNTAYIAALNGASIASGATVTTADLRGSYGVPSHAQGIMLMLKGSADAKGGELRVESADDTPDAYSPQLYCPQADAGAALLSVRIGLSGASAGKIKVSAYGANFAGVYGWVTGYWI